MRRVLFFGAALAFLSACGPGGVGQQCVGGASTNDCVDGAVCTLEPSMFGEPPPLPNNEVFFCRTICDTNDECADDGEGFTCQRANGTMFSSCQPPRDTEEP